MSVFSVPISEVKDKDYVSRANECNVGDYDLLRSFVCVWLDGVLLCKKQDSV